jgi:hypothetical protein
MANKIVGSGSLNGLKYGKIEMKNINKSNNQYIKMVNMTIALVYDKELDQYRDENNQWLIPYHW